MNDRANVLILYYCMQYPIRATIRDHLYSFKRHSSHRCCYLNLAVGGIPWYVKSLRWDLVIFHTVFLSSRWTRELFISNMDKVGFLKDSDAVKVALPQDEFLNTDLLCDFINQLGISHVFSVSPESEWPLIYRTVDFQKVQFHKVLTGYIEGSLIEKISKLVRGLPGEREIEVGYRARRTAFWLGRHGALKWKIADVFEEKAPQKGLAIDISTRDEDVIAGDDWYRFLLRCKYQLGVEGGASVLDRDGAYRKSTEQYVAEHPTAAFEEVEAACFPGADGSLKLFALSPRHFECCLTRTCQVLIEGDYDGVLVPGKHYIELKRDFSNLDEVLDIVASDERREEITARAWRDIVEPGAYTYRSFVNQVMDSSLAGSVLRARLQPSAIWHQAIACWMLLRDKATWLAIAVALRCYYPVRYALMKRFTGVLPGPVRRLLRQIIQRVQGGS